MNLHVVIVGNGITGVSAALEVRRLEPKWKITMISGEAPHFFSRPALMYFYMGHMSLEDIKPYEDWFWTHQGIDLIQAWVQGVDIENKELLFDGRDRLPFDKLLFATGSQPNKFGWPGQDFEGVQGFYSLQDVESLEAATSRLHTAVIVGGGLIGIELAECLHSRGAQVIMLAREKSYWNNILPSGESEMVTEVIRNFGIDLQLEEELAEIIDDGKGRACAVKTKSGEKIDCELVGLTVGVGPNLSAIRDSEITTGRGILVDDSFETNVDDVYAAGDCAEIVTSEGERNKIEQLWYTGKMQGVVVGRRMAGREASYERGILYNSAKFVDLEWHTYGLVPSDVTKSEKPESRSLYWEHEDHRHCMRIAHDDGVVKGMNAMGIRQRHRRWERWIAEGRDLEYVLAHLREACFDPELFHRYEAQIVGTMKEHL